MGIPGHAGDHEWSQRHLSHYVEGDLRPRAPPPPGPPPGGGAGGGRGLRAMRALVYAAQGLDGLAGVRAPAAIFDRARQAGPASTAAPSAP
jgi:hypothetical protein